MFLKLLVGFYKSSYELEAETRKPERSLREGGSLTMTGTLEYAAPEAALRVKKDAITGYLGVG